jgi:hypothetical protein
MTAYKRITGARSPLSKTQYLITLHRQLRKPLGIDELGILPLQICL